MVFTQLGILRMQLITWFHAVYSEKCLQKESFLNIENNEAWFLVFLCPRIDWKNYAKTLA